MQSAPPSHGAPDFWDYTSTRGNMDVTFRVLNTLLGSQEINQFRWWNAKSPR